MILKPMDPFRIMCGQLAQRALTKVTQNHEESLRHFQQAELELLRGVRSLAEEEVRLLTRLITKREASVSHPTPPQPPVEDIRDEAATGE